MGAKSQDLATGDGTTTVVILCGSLLKKCLELIDKGVHPSINSELFCKTSQAAIKFLENKLGIPIDIRNRNLLIKVANTSLNSKLVSNYSQLSVIAVDCVLKVINPSCPDLTDLRNVKIFKKLGRTIDDSEIVDGFILDHKTSYKLTNLIFKFK